MVSGIEQGLFVLRPNEAAGGADGVLGSETTEPEPCTHPGKGKCKDKNKDKGNGRGPNRDRS